MEECSPIPIKGVKTKKAHKPPKSLKNGYFEEKEALNGRMLVAGRGFEPRISGL